jgi:hypothetical protein
MKKKDVFISLAIIGAAGLTLWLYLRQEGCVRIDAGDAIAELQVRNGWFGTATIMSGAGPVQANTRVYNARRLNILQKQNGQDWRIESVGPWGELSRITIRRNETATLRLGPPFLVKPGISRRGSDVSIDYAIIGQAGERYQSFATKDGRAMPGAKISIIDEAGNVLETGQFSYG